MHATNVTFGDNRRYREHYQRPSKRLRAIEDEFEIYDVFLSHRGPDTKTGFVSYLYEGLQAAGLRPFLDCKSIDKGQDAWKCIDHAIKTVPIALVIFSESFAQSDWCLKELHVMLDSPGLKVLPIFYKVQPYEVSFPEKGQLATGFEKLKQRHDEIIVEQWKVDLKKASKLNGWEHKAADRRVETDLVKEVVGKISELVNHPLPLDVGEYVIGVEQVAEAIIKKLEDLQKLADLQKHGDNNKFLILGLWGMGGIGKSTLARELYNRLGTRFAASCFVEDVKQKVIQSGIVKVQNRILKDVCPSESEKIKDKSKGKTILEERLCKKHILVVLDDVSDSDDMSYFISRKMLLDDPSSEEMDYSKTRKLFTECSMCIVTSRDRRVFEELNSFDLKHEIYIHNVQVLNNEDSKRVSTSYAFGGDCKVKPGLEDLVANISKARGGVPLVLKACGALLKEEENMDIWEEVMKKLNCGTIMDENKIFECLRISYDALKSQYQEMFLDIACAVLGQSEDMTKRVWRSLGWSPALGVRSLVEKALITVDGEGRFVMHDLIRDMGHEIERRKRISEGVVRRLWMPESLRLLEEGEPLPDSLQTLIICNNINKFMYKMDGSTIDLDLSHMKELRILICDRSLNVTSLLPKTLRCVEGKVQSRHGTENIFPTTPQDSKLVVLSLKGSNIQRLPESFGKLSNLEVFEWRIGGELIILPDSFGELSNLEVLNLECCSELIMLPDSFGYLKNLRILNLAFSRIESFPESFGKLKNLKVLNLSFCNELVILPDSFRGLNNLRDLDLTNSGIKSLPWSFGELSNLKELNLGFCEELSMLPDSFGGLKSLRSLDLGHSGIKCLANSFTELSNLEVLNLSFCRKLILLPDLFGALKSLRTLDLSHSGIERLPESSSELSNVEVFNLSYCRKLIMLPNSFGSLNERGYHFFWFREFPRLVWRAENLLENAGSDPGGLGQTLDNRTCESRIFPSTRAHASPDTFFGLII